MYDIRYMYVRCTSQGLEIGNMSDNNRKLRRKYNKKVEIQNKTKTKHMPLLGWFFCSLMLVNSILVRSIPLVWYTASY